MNSNGKESMMQAFHKRMWFWMGSGLLLAVVGCSKGPHLGRVHGTVTWAGQPVPFAYVEFQPIEPRGTYGAAYSDAEGKYELLFSKTQKGALVGQHQVTVRTAGRDEIQVEDKKTGLMVTPSLPPGYKPKLQVQFDREVKSGTNELNFELQDATATASRN